MRKDKDAQRAYIREYMRETRAFYHSHGRCAECGKADAYTIGGRYRCAECAEKRRLWDHQQDGRNVPRTVTSYCVISCPMYVMDERTKKRSKK